MDWYFDKKKKDLKLNRLDGFVSYKHRFSQDINWSTGVVDYLWIIEMFLSAVTHSLQRIHW